MKIATAITLSIFLFPLASQANEDIFNHNNIKLGYAKTKVSTNDFNEKSHSTEVEIEKAINASFSGKAHIDKTHGNGTDPLGDYSFKNNSYGIGVEYHKLLGDKTEGAIGAGITRASTKINDGSSYKANYKAAYIALQHKATLKMTLLGKIGHNFSTDGSGSNTYALAEVKYNVTKNIATGLSYVTDDSSVNYSTNRFFVEYGF